MMHGRVLVIAGSDSGGGAGIQADIKTICAFGAYAATAVTAITAQDTNGVRAIHPVPADIVARQIACVLEDIGADAIKSGMLGDAAAIRTVAKAIAEYPGLPFVLDPVMVAKGGAVLLEAEAVAELKRSLLPFASLLTPNVPEAEILSGMAIQSEQDMLRAAEAMLTLGVPAVLLKGGHLPGDEVIDLLASEDGTRLFRSRRIHSRHTHGTGCTLASAIAASLAQGIALEPAVMRARDYVRRAIEAAPGFGRGHGPLNHLVSPPPASMMPARRSA